MKHVEIETGERPGGGWGYVIHYYDTEDVTRYKGCDDVRGRHGSDGEAREAAARTLDEWYGEGGWEHI